MFAFLVAFVFGTHFGIRSAKGYANVIRFSLIHRSIIQKRLQLPDVPSHAELKHLIDLYLYNVRWALPIRRADVFNKVLFEFGFGYLLSITAALAIYAAIQMPFSPRVPDLRQCPSEIPHS